MARLIDADALRYDLCVSNCSAYEICGAQCRTIRIINEQPTIEADIDRAAILRLCNEIEVIITTIANYSDSFQTVEFCRAVCDRLKEIGKELTGCETERTS